jgi:MoxR-like ATPase
MTDSSLSDLEQTIGGPPWLNNINDNYRPNHIISANTNDLWNWAILRGMPQEKLTQLSRQQLEKCYCIKNYFDAVANNTTARNLRDSRMAARNSGNNAYDIGAILGNPAIPQASSLPQASSPTITDARPKDSIQHLLGTVEKTIDNKLHALKSTITHETTFNINQTISELKTKIADEIVGRTRSEIENGDIQVKLGKGLEAKILEIVRNSTEEIVFQAIRKSGRREEQRAQEGQEGELAGDQELVPPAPLALSLPFVPELDPNFYIDPYAGRVIRKALATGEHVFAYGPAGCGKTTHFEQVCATLGHGVKRINPHDGITREFFFGGMKLEEGETRFHYGALPIAMKNGLALLVDEFSFLQANLAAILHPVMEKSGKLYIPETDETITAAPGFCVFATDNTGGKGDSTGQFSGVEVQNTATLDRFAYCLKMDYLPRAKEEEMLLKRFKDYILPGSLLPHTELDKMLSLAQDIRGAFARGELAITLSTRKLINYFFQREQGFSQSETLSNCLLSWLDDDDRQLVNTMLDRLEIQAEEYKDI